MSTAHDTSFLARTHALDDGPRVRLRLARRSDEPLVRDLLAARGVGASDLDVRRLLSYDLARRRVLCAFAPLGGRESLVGLGGIDLEVDADPDTVVVDERLTDGLGELLGSVLRRLAQAHGRRAA